MNIKKVAAFAIAAAMLIQSAAVFAEDLTLQASESQSQSVLQTAASDESTAVSEAVSSSEAASSSVESSSSEALSSSETISSSEEASSSSSEVSASSEEASSSEAVSSSEIASSGESVSSVENSPAAASEPAENELDNNLQAPDGVAAFVTRLYEITLERAPDAAGLADWINRLSSGAATGAQVMQGFFDADEYKAKNKSNEAFITDVYRAAFNRAPDTTGYNDWAGRLENYVSRNYILAGFAGSDEFKELCAAYGIAPGSVTLTESRDQSYEITSFVTRLYKTALGRTPDTAGLNENTGRVITGQVSGAQLAAAFFTSSEYTSKNKSDSEFLADLYSAMFNHSGDAAGIADWTERLNNGVSRTYVINGFAGSSEFTALCQSYGITPGSVALTESRDQNLAVTSFVARLYKYALGRTGDVTGLNDWTGRLLNRRISGTQAAVGFFESAEFIGANYSNDEFINRVYLVALNRDADADGKATWLEYLNAGVSKNGVLAGVLNSSEFQKLCADSGISFTEYVPTATKDIYKDLTTFIYYAYTGLFGRAPSDSEIDAQTAALQSGATGAQLLNALFGSEGFTARNLSDADFVRAAYLAALERNAGDIEVATQVSYLASHTRLELLAVLIDSTEYRAVCAKRGVAPGSLSGKTVWNILDVSQYQGNIDWSAVAASGDIDGVIIRAVSTNNRGLYVDPYFEANVIGAKRAGLKVGAYYVLYGTTPAECQAEVNLLLEQLARLESQGYYFDLPIACDLEYNVSQLTRNDLTMLGRYSMNLVEQAGYYPLLYTYVNFARYSINLSDIGSRDIWIAYYPYLNADGTPRATPAYPASYQMWQYRSDAHISGISGNVDLSYAYKDYASMLTSTVRADGTKWNKLK